MKKIVFILLAISLALLPVFASGEYASKTDDELMTELNLIRAEIVKRAESKEASRILVDADGITVSLKGEIQFEELHDGTHYIIINVTVVNSSDSVTGVRVDECYINGWKIYGYLNSILEPGTKEKTTIEIYKVDEEAEVKKFEDLEDIKLVFVTFNGENYYTLTNGISHTITF